MNEVHATLAVIFNCSKFKNFFKLIGYTRGSDASKLQPLGLENFFWELASYFSVYKIKSFN